ncbi:MAG TPA: hypothetical protein EYO58_11815 [Flavobacteriales bacterium]|nr:hypothetical protein [Flavobacteriales bacterium]
MGQPALRSCPADKPVPTEEKMQPSLPDETLTPQQLPASASVIDREMCSTKLHSRPLAPGVSHAPFASETDYVTGLTNEEMYLRPKSSHDQNQPLNSNATA